MKKTDPHLFILEGAYKKAAAAAKKNPGHKEIKALDAAKAAIDAHKKRRAEEAGDNTAPLANLTEVLDYLQTKGWKIEKSKLYADTTLIKREKDGTYTRAAADKYAKDRHLTRMDGSDVFDPSSSEAYNRYMKARARREEEAYKKAQRENETAARRLVLRSEVRQLHTAKLGQLITAFDNFIYSGPLDEAIELVNGEVKHIEVLQEFLSEKFRGLLAEYAKSPRFTIPKKKALEAEELMSPDD